MNAPLAIDLYCGLGGWTQGLLEEGFRVVGGLKQPEDRLVAMRFLENDARVVELIVRKYFGDKPGIGVAITPLSDEQHRPEVHEHTRASTLANSISLFDFSEDAR